MAEAETGDLLRYFAVTRTTGDIRRVVGDRLAGPQADCAARQRGQRRVRTRSYPDFDIGVRPPPGGRSWTVVRWNVDDQGRATNVETLGSSGDAALDAETRRAVSETVLAGGSPARGCVYNFHRNGLTLVAPDMPAAADRPEDPLQNCPADVGASYKTRMEPIYPRAFRERGIEGWALVRFDIATWGQVGNVEVIEAQPAAAFGESARHAVMTGSARPGFEAGVRCVIPIRYRTSDAAEALEPSTD